MLDRKKRDLVSQVIKDHDPETVDQLAALIQAEGALDEETFIETIKEMARDGSLKLEPPKYPIRSFLDYLFTLNVSSWFWFTIAITGLTAMLALLPSGFLPLDVLRWGFGSVFLVFLPGYSCLQLLFPRPLELRRSQRYLFSVPISLAMLILIGLVLNYSDIGIRLDSLLESIGSIIVVLASSAAFRLYSLNRT